MIVCCPKCKKRYDDTPNWTICPHNPLDVRPDAAYCRKHDLFNCYLCTPQEQANSNTMKHEISHSEMVAKLIKSGTILKSEWVERDFELMHATIGIVGECGELAGGIDYAVTNKEPLDRTNVIEELGDLEFYMENLRSILSIARNDVLNCETVCWVAPTVNQITVHMLIYSTDLMDQIKKATIYRKELNREAVLANLSKIEWLVEHLRKHLGLTYEQCLQANIDKLAVRYKDFEYSNQQAQDRADKSRDDTAIVDDLKKVGEREEDDSN